MDPAASQSRLVTVRCAHCGDIDQLNERSYRRRTAQGKPHYCEICRTVRSFRLTPDDRSYWTTRFSQQEIDAMVSRLG
jgi:hypothetical protein